MECFDYSCLRHQNYHHPTSLRWVISGYTLCFAGIALIRMRLMIVVGVWPSLIALQCSQEVVGYRDGRLPLLLIGEVRWFLYIVICFRAQGAGGRQWCANNGIGSYSTKDIYTIDETCLHTAQLATYV